MPIKRFLASLLCGALLLIAGCDSGGGMEGGGGEGDSTAVAAFMEEYITTTMNRYADAVVGWDVVWSYLQNVPEDQRSGVTVWNLTDASTWIVRIQEENDYPTLYDADYNAKLAYAGFLRGLKGEAPADGGE